MKNNSDSLNTLIGKGTSLKGDVIVDGSLRIDGELEGSLKANNFLIVGKSGILKADVDVKNAIIGGKIIGNVSVEEKLELESSSSCTGDLKAKVLQISPGAVFDGNCTMSKTSKN